MIDIKVGGSEGIAKCHVSGTVLDLIAESLVVLKVVHDVIGQQDEGAASAYKMTIKDNIESAFGEDPAWVRDIKETYSKKKPSLDDQFGDVIGELNALCDRVDKITGGRK